MNNPSPLVPQGSLQEQKNQGRARVKIAVFVVLAVHGIGLLALLMQGCKKEPEPTGAPPDQAATNVAPPFVEPTNMPVADTNVPAPAVAPPPTAPEQAAPPAVTDYKIVAGDTFSTIARKFHVTTAALMNANPGLEPTKLQIGQSIKIPPPAPAAAATGGTASPVADVAAGEQMYVVKSGDTLSKIATDHGTTVRALRSANNLTTDRIKVGQKLKIPVKAAAAAVTSPPAPALPVPGATSAPPALPPQ